MASVNKVIILGTFGRDPEVRFMPNGEAVANFSIATTESWKDKSGAKQEKTEWHNLVAYRKLAEIIGEYMKKGSSGYFEGRLQTRKWEKDGVTRYATEIIVDSMQMLGGKRDTQNGGSNNSDDNNNYSQGGDYSQSNSAPQQSSSQSTGGGSNYDPNDEIPFSGLGRGMSAYVI